MGVSIFYIFFKEKTAKNLKIGNNSSSQEIVDYILNISSYEATINVDVTSNKNTNKYILKQQYISPDVATQEVLEPSNISGIKIIKKGNDLKLENTSLKTLSHTLALLNKATLPNHEILLSLAHFN